MNARLVQVITREVSAIRDADDAATALRAVIGCCACCADDPAAEAVAKLADRLLDTLYDADDLRARLEEVTCERDLAEAKLDELEGAEA
jgi:hypothetical protein